ncbi:hypothetical protein [Azospirillum rugosum]|uniref:Glycine zipper domain-containing protein n=1 Tax=Azospirillum rugosum TaxID=416170 RepID=A0ABS4SW99_9PROT|nr:hypothetical protein [Azospirillum rugosum]MBP2296509.1 hypothetical protein [Azospirillum rugosum]MDQ0530091.1 hypothetical protein [Azospirillum rugosum]
MHPILSRAAAAVLLASGSLGAPAAMAAPPAEGSWGGWLSDKAAVLQDGAEKAIILGGALVYQNRHTIAGLTLGCAAGAAVGATSGVAAGLATGGAALPATGPAAALGCALGGVAGAQLGRPLDQPMP